MRRLLLLLIVAFVVFVYVCRMRLFLRDPIATVQRNGITVQQTGVLINYANDILLDDQSTGHNRVYLVQNWNLVPSTPAELKCLAFFACLGDQDHVTATPIQRGLAKPAVMTNKRVDFVDEDGAVVAVTLR